MQPVELHDTVADSRATVLVGRGFNCCRWQVVGDTSVRELLWAEPGFEAGAGRPSGSGIPLLFPFPGRIAHGQFSFAGRTYLMPHDEPRTHVLHGFVFNRPWRLVDQQPTRVTAAFQASIDDPSILNHWPSDFSIEATYELAGTELRFNATLRNTGYDEMPWAFGTHAYFRLPLVADGDVADTVLTAPVDGQWQLDDMLATGKLLDLPPDVTLADGLRLGEHQFDAPFRLATKAGPVATVVADPASGRRITQTFDAAEFPHLVIYTPGHRQAVCLEPYTCVPDPFRLEAKGIASGLRTLAPGQSHQTSFVLRAD